MTTDFSEEKKSPSFVYATFSISVFIYMFTVEKLDGGSLEQTMSFP